MKSPPTSAAIVLSRGNADFDVRHNLSAAVTYNLPSPNGAPVLKHVFGNWFVDGIVHAQSGLPVNVTAASYTVVDGMYVYVRPNYVPGQPLYIYDSSVPGGRRFNSAAFTTAYDPAYPDIRSRGTLGAMCCADCRSGRSIWLWGGASTSRRSGSCSSRANCSTSSTIRMFGGYGTTLHHSQHVRCADDDVTLQSEWYRPA